MSYPPGPQEPYGPQPPRQAYGPPPQGYGHPQQQPYGAAYPRGSAYGPPGGVPATPPGKTTVARILMFVAGGVQLLLTILVGSLGAVLLNEIEENVGYSGGALYAGVSVSAVHAMAGLILASQFGKGPNGIRTGAFVWAALIILLGLFWLPLGILWIAVGVVVIVMLANAESGAWFNRP